MEPGKDDGASSSTNKTADQNIEGRQEPELFRGSLDASALAAEQEELERLVACMEETLEDNEVDMQFEQDEFSIAAKRTTETFVPGDTAVNIESIAMKVFHETTAKMLQDQREEFIAQIIPSHEQTGQHKLQNAREVIDGHVEDNGSDSASEIGSDHAGRDDLSIDDFVTSQQSASSSTTSSSETSLDHESKSDGDDDDDNHNDGNSLHSASIGGPSRSGSSRHSSRSSMNGSAASLSIFEIQNTLEDHTENETVWIQHGILRVDESSKEQAFICDWDLFRKWKKRKRDSSTRQHSANNSHLESSSQRWAGRSAQDRNLTMPRRRTSDSTHGTRSSVNNDTNNATAEGDDYYPADNVPFFDWKAWRRRKDGHLSSTSRTNSFSLSAEDNDDDDEFDAKSVLAKLHEWEAMMEEPNKSEGNEVSDSPMSPSGDAAGTGGGALNRAHSEVFGSKRTSVPVRSNSDQSIKVDEEKVGNDGDRQWKDWRREQRKMRLGGSWSNLSSQLSPGSDAGGAIEDFTDGAESEIGQAVPDLPCQSPVNRSQSDKASGAIRSPQMARSNSFVLKRTFHQSPLRSPKQKAALQQSPKIGPEWKKWQREKRRTGIWKRTFSDRDSWGLPFNDDKVESPENSSDTDDASNRTSGGSSKREGLKKSQSEKWDANAAVSGGKGGNRRSQMRRAHSMPPSREGCRNNVFDWKSWRKDKEKPGLQRSQSDRWSSSTSEASDKSDKPPAPPSARKGMRRSQSEKWNNKNSSNLPEASPQSEHQAPPESTGPQPPDTAGTGSFDWKGWKKDKQKTIRRSKSMGAATR